MIDQAKDPDLSTAGSCFKSGDLVELNFIWNFLLAACSTISSLSKPLHSILSCIFTLMIFALLSYSADQLPAESCLKSGDLVIWYLVLVAYSNITLLSKPLLSNIPCIFNILCLDTLTIHVLLSSLADQCISSIILSTIGHSTIFMVLDHSQISEYIGKLFKYIYMKIYSSLFCSSTVLLSSLARSMYFFNNSINYWLFYHHHGIRLFSNL